MPELIGFGPDLDPRTPGVFVEGSSAFVPTTRGMAGAPTPVDLGAPALESPCLGAASIRVLSGGRRTIAGTDTKLQELTGTVWVNLSKPGGYATGGNRWRFTQFGDDTIATNRTDPMQFSSAGFSFADLPGSPPKARFVDTVGLFVIAADTIEGTFGDQPDRWWCSALGNHKSWIPSISTQCASGRLLDADGQITASRGLGNSWILYKRDAIYVGSYVGGDVIWAFERVPGNIGCVAHDSIVNLQSAHLFRGRDDFYIFDGNRAEPIGRNVKEFYSRSAAVTLSSRVTALHDRSNTLIYWFYPSASSLGNPDRALVYHYETQKWGVLERSIEAVTESISNQLTWDELGTIAQTWDDLPLISWDDPSWVSGAESPAIFDTSHKMAALSGTPETAYFRTWQFGVLERYTGFSRVYPRFSRPPGSGKMTPRFQYRSNESFQDGLPITMVNGRFSYLRNALLHEFFMEFTGDFELIDVSDQDKAASYE